MQRFLKCILSISFSFQSLHSFCIGYVIFSAQWRNKNIQSFCSVSNLIDLYASSVTDTHTHINIVPYAFPSVLVYWFPSVEICWFLLQFQNHRYRKYGKKPFALIFLIIFLLVSFPNMRTHYIYHSLFTIWSDAVSCMCTCSEWAIVFFSFCLLCISILNLMKLCGYFS